MFRSYIVVSMFMLGIALVACSGGGETVGQTPPNEDDSGAAEIATATATTAPATATTEPPTATAEPPSATPEPSPTQEPAPQPEPTEEMAEMVPEDSSEDSGQGGSEASGSGWGESGTGAQSACDHPYLPIRSGATWTYQAGEEMLIWEVVDVQGDMDEASAVLNITVGDVSLSYHWDCKADQGIASFDFASLTSVPVGIDMELKQESVEGQFLLPADQLIPGASWTAKLLSKISFSQEAAGTSVEVTGDMTTVQDHTVLVADPVEINGQSVPGLQIEQASTIDMSLAIMGVTTAQSFSVVTNYEMGYGIGIVTQTSYTDFGTETTSLVDYSIP